MIINRAAFGSIILTFVLISCSVATHSRLHLAENYLQTERYDEAIRFLEIELKKEPANKELQVALLRARLNKFYNHLLKARKLAKSEQTKKQAIEEYNRALQIFPDNYELQREIELFTNLKKAEQPLPSKITPPAVLNVNPNQKFSFKLRNVQMSNIFRSLGNLFKINFVFDRDFRDFPYTIEFDSTTFYELLDALCLAASSRYRTVNNSTLLIYPDNYAKKRQLEQKGIQLFFLSNLKAEDAKKMLASIYREEQLIMQEDTTLNTLAVRADYETLLTVEKLLRKIDRPRSEVELNLEIMEINRSLVQKLGSELSTWGAGFSVQNNEGKSNFNLKDFSANYILTLPSAFLHLLEADSSSRIIAKPNLRGISGEEISFAVGDEVPIPETQFQAIAAGGINTSPVTTYKYQKVGLEIKIIPQIHQNDEITIKSKLTLKFISGTGYSQAFPVLGTREVENILRLRDGEVNIIGGFIRDDIRKSLKGFPALSKIPLLGKLFGNSDDSIQQTDLIFIIKPRIIRKNVFNKEDLDAIWSEVKASGEIEGGGFINPQRQQEQMIPFPPDHRPEDEDRPEMPREEAEGAMNEQPHIEKMSSEKLIKLDVIPQQLIAAQKRDSTLTLQISGKGSSLSEITINGEIVGGKATIISIIGNFLANSTYQKNISGQIFNINILLNRPLNLTGSPILLAQLLTSFENKGDYQLIISSASAFDRSGNPLTVIYQPSTIRVQ